MRITWILLLCFLSAKCTDYNLELVLDILAQLKQQGAKCAALIASTNAPLKFEEDWNLNLPVFILSVDATPASLEEVNPTCPFYIFHLMTVNLTSSFLKKNYDFLKRRDAYYVHILSAPEEEDELLSLPYFRKVLHVLTYYSYWKRPRFCR